VAAADATDTKINRPDLDEDSILIEEESFSMKASKAKISKPDFQSLVRIMLSSNRPLSKNETVVLDKAYHPRCYSKLSPESVTAGTAFA